jgi:putative endonuclease
VIRWLGEEAVRLSTHLRALAARMLRDSSRKRKGKLTSRQLTGRWGEQKAEELLREKGYRILGRRVRLSPRDELDLVARKDGVLVFVEVKTRRTENYGRPVEAVNRDKRRALSRAAHRYLQRLRAKPPYFRFDVVEVVGAEGDPNPIVRHLENVFTLSRQYKIPW